MSFRLGSPYKDRVSNGYRAVLSDAGLRTLARADRRKTSDLAKHWQITPDGEGYPKFDVKAYRLDGTKLRKLARELDHTDAVSEFTAMMAAEARRHSSYELLSALPPHRWDRTFRYNGKRAVIRPDAAYVVNYQGSRDVYLLEYEKRAGVPARMKPKVTGWQKYYGSMDTQLDFDGRLPRTLFVFADSAQAGRFIRFALRQGGDEMPMFISSMDVLRNEGIFGNSWFYPWAIDRGRVQFAMLRRGRRWV